jgi:hypothetical protein
MDYSIMSQSGHTLYNVEEFVVDTPADISNLPTYCATGSTAIVISTAAVWMFGVDQQWHEVGGGT